jgi:RHS repeat-associated protein
VSAPQLNISRPSLQAGSVFYRGVAPGTTLSYTLSASGLQEKILLASPLSPTTFYFHLSDPHQVLGAVHDDGSGGVYFEKLIDGDVRIRIPRQFAYEAALDRTGPGPLVDPTSASLVVRRSGDGFNITVSAAQSWLAHHRLPVVLDPQFTFTEASGNMLIGWDGHVDSSNCSAGPEACGISTASDLAVGADNDGSPYSYEPARTYARFDLTSIPEGAQISSAALNVFAVGPLGNSNDVDETPGDNDGDSGGDTDGDGGYQGGFTLEMHELTQPLSTGLSYTQLAAATSPSLFESTSLHAWYHVNACDCVELHLDVAPTEITGWVNNPRGNNGISMQMDTGSEANPTTGGIVWADTGPYGQQYGNLPNLQVTYTRPDYGPLNWGFQSDEQNPPLHPQNGNQSYLGPNDSTGTKMWVYVVNQGTQVWPAGGNYKIGYHIYDSTGGTLKYWDGARTTLVNDVYPGTGTWVDAQISPMSSLSAQGGNDPGPLPDGIYTLQWDVLNEGVTWLSQQPGVTTAPFHLLVTTPPKAGAVSNTSLTPTITASSCNNSDGSPNTLCNSYQFQVSSDPSFSAYITSSGWIASTAPSVTWQVPAGVLEAGITYYWRVQGRSVYSVSSYQETPSSNWSNEKTFTTATPPATPASVTAQASQWSDKCTLDACQQSVKVSWSPPPSDGGALITSYQVTPYLDWAQQASVNVSAPLTTVSFSGLTDGGTYAFTVAASNAIGQGIPSDFTATVVPTGEPGAPSDVTAVAGDSQVYVSWTPPADAATDVTGYQVTTYAVLGGSLVPGLTVSVAAAASSILITQNIIDGFTYTFGVASVNSGGGVVVTNPLVSPVTMEDGTSTPSSTPPNIGSLSFDKTSYARGESATLTAGNLKPTSGWTCESGDKLNIPLPAGVDGRGATVSITGQTPTCNGGSTATSASTISVVGLAVPSTGLKVTATARMLGFDSICANWTVTATLSNGQQAGTNATTKPATICDGGLGLQPWWSYAGAHAGPGGQAQINAANGNLIFSQRDSTRIQLHGHLVLGTMRTYNSEEVASPIGQTLGSGWTISWLTAGDQIGGVALRTSSDEHVTQGQVVTLISDSGSRVTFIPTDLGTPVDVTGLASSTGQLAPLIPTSLSSDSGYSRICANTTYKGEAGIHISMWRYVESSTGTCSGLTERNAQVLGYATISTDRVRREFSADGRLLSVRDASGNRVDFGYDTGNRLASVTEAGGTNRAYALTYTTWAGGKPEVDVQDPAGRVTDYQENGNGYLVNVLNPNPNGGALHYSYGGCGGAASQLCSAQDPDGNTMSFQYSAAALGPPQVATLNARGGTPTTISYAAGQMTADTGNERQKFASIDNAGRVGVLKEGDKSNAWLHSTIYTWDTPTKGCRQPDESVDNNLCSVFRQALNGGTTPDRHTAYTYNDEGGILIQDEKATPSPDVVTTASYISQYVDADGSPNGYVHPFLDLVNGSGRISSDAGSPNRRDPTTVFIISDQTGVLTPNGNAATSGYSDYLTTYTRDANSGVGAGLPITSPKPCAAGGVNSGSLCQVSAPAPGSNRAVTKYTYNGSGQRLTLTTPDENAGSESGSAYSYAYYADGAKDLSGTTSAGGWLKGITDPTGNFVAFAYDAAGDVVRTWERNATATHTMSDFPGSITSPPSNAPYAQTLYGAGTGTSAYSNPWRFILSERDAIGNFTTDQRDLNGNLLGVRSAAGNQAAVAPPTCPTPSAPSTPQAHDSCFTYDAEDRELTAQMPLEGQQNGSPHTTNKYDQWGNLVAVTDADGFVTTYGYDKVNRQTGRNWTRGPWQESYVPAGCRQSTQADAPIPSGRIECSTNTVYDGVDNVTGVSDPGQANDGTGRTIYTTYQYDAIHRVIHSYAPRYDGTFRLLRSDTVYDQDGNITDTCPPREFTEAHSTGCTSSGYFSTHQSYNAADLIVASTRYLGYLDPTGDVCPSSSSYTCTPETTRYTYDADGNRLSLKDGNGHLTRYSYDVLDRLTSTVIQRDPATSYTTSYGYDASGNRTWTEQPVGVGTGASTRDTLTTYDADNRKVDTVVAAADATGNPTRDISLISITDANGGTNIHSRQLYDAEGNMVAMFSPRAFGASSTAPNREFMVRVDYDADGRPVTQYVPRYDTNDASVAPPGVTSVWPGQASQASDCPTNQSAQSVTGVPNYRTTTGVCISSVAYDPDGRITRQLLPTAAGDWTSARKITYDYTDDGLVAVKNTPNPLGDDASPAKTTNYYDADGNLTTQLDAYKNATNYSWSLDRLLLGMVRPQGPYGQVHSQGAAYDANGNQISSLDGFGATTVNSFTSNNLEQSVGTPAGGAAPNGNLDNTPLITSYTYDKAANRLTSLSPNASAGDPDNRQRTATLYTYTFDNLLAMTELPPGGDGQRAIANTYDGAGERVSQRSFLEAGADGGTLGYQYYLDGRIKEEDARDSSTAKRFQYDADGNTTSWSEDGTGASSYYIDGRLLQLDDTGYTSQWSYDGAGHMATRTMTNDTNAAQGASTEAASYTNFGQIAELRSTRASSSETRRYDAVGQPAQVVQTISGVTTSTISSYNSDNSLGFVAVNQATGSSSGQLARWWYVYDNDYRLSNATSAAYVDGVPQPYVFAALSYSYYPDGRLQQYGLSNQGSDAVITYDHDGNRTAWTPPFSTSGVSTSTYNPDDSLSTSSSTGGGFMTYDPDGRLHSDGCTTNTYDGFDRLARVDPVTASRPAACGALPSNPPSTTYAYDALDRQARHSDETGSWWFHFADMGTEVGVMSNPPTGTADDRFLVSDDTGTPRQAIELQSPGTAQGLIGDGQGNLGVVTGADGLNACVLAYDPYGASLFAQKSSNACVGHGSQLTELGYHFAPRDATTGNYTFGARTYDPSKAAFLTPDAFRPGSTSSDVSIGSDPLTEDRYAYVNGDPVNRFDPTGHCFDPCSGNPVEDGGGNGGGMPCEFQGTCTSPPRPTPPPSHNDQGCDGPKASALGCHDAPDPSAPSLGEISYFDAPNMFTPSVGQMEGYVGFGLWPACRPEDQNGAFMCSDASGRGTLTPQQYAPGDRQPWWVNLLFLLTLGKGPVSLVGASGDVAAASVADTVAAGATDATAGVLSAGERAALNQGLGNGWRDQVAAEMDSLPNRVANTEVYKWTPFGRRFIDVEVSDESGQVLGGIETKFGDSPYTVLQEWKDMWLQYFQGYRVNVLRYPG